MLVSFFLKISTRLCPYELIRMVAATAGAPILGGLFLLNTMSGTGSLVATISAATTGVVYGATGTAASVAVTGAAVSGTAITGGLATGAVMGAAPVILVAQGLVIGSIGLALCGADGYTWDCWKPVVMDNSVGPSCGITLNDLSNHPNLKQMTMDMDSFSFVAENIRGECYRLSPVIANHALAYHASPIQATLVDK
jgi:hypothetical protein